MKAFTFGKGSSRVLLKHPTAALLILFIDLLPATDVRSQIAYQEILADLCLHQSGSIKLHLITAEVKS